MLILFQKTYCGPTSFYHLEEFEAFIIPKILNLKWKFKRRTEVGKSFDFFDFLLSILSHFSIEVANNSLKADLILSSFFVERLPSI